MKTKIKAVQRTRLSNGKRIQRTYYLYVNMRKFNKLFKTFNTGDVVAYKKGNNYYYNDRTIGISTKYIPLEKVKQ